MSLSCPNCGTDLELRLVALPGMGKPCVYLLRNPHTKLVKIGQTADFPKRRRALELQGGAELEVEEWVECETPSDAKALEAELHRRFASLRKIGEWFTDDPEIHRAFLGVRT